MLLLGVGNGMTLPNATAGIVNVKPQMAGSASGLGGTIQLGLSAIISMILSESASVFILKKYFVYSIKNYLLKVHVKCFFITIISSIIPFLFYQKLIEPSFIRLIYTLLLTTSSISITVYAFGLNPEEREKILMIIKKRIMK